MADLDLGSITISYYLDEDGDIISGVTLEGDLPVVVQVGLLEMAKDTILRAVEDDE